MKPLTIIEKAFLLKKNCLFKEFDLDLLLPIANNMNMLFFEQGDHIFDIGNIAHNMYLIAKGTVIIKNKNDNMLTTLDKGDFFGEESLFNERPRAYTATSHTDNVLLSLSQTNILTIISECPSLAISLLKIYSENMEFRGEIS